MDAIQDIRRYEVSPNGASSSSSPHAHKYGYNQSSNNNDTTSSDEYDEFAYDRVGPTPHLEALCMRLLPLRHIESLLIAKLVPPNEDEATRLGVKNPPSHLGYSSSSTLINSDYSHSTDYGHHHRHHPSHGGIDAFVDEREREKERQPFSYRHQPEIFVRPTNTSWKGSLKRYGRPSSLGNTGLETQDESQVVINECRGAMISLWGDKLVREVLKRRKIRLEESPGL